jgi:hypothetical protein
VSDAQAAEAVREGYAIVVSDDESWRDFASIRFEKEPPRDPSAADPLTPRQRLAYRQAALFVASLRERDPTAFAQLLRRVEDGASFKEPFRATFDASPGEMWRRFVADLSK